MWIQPFKMKSELVNIFLMLPFSEPVFFYGFFNKSHESEYKQMWPDLWKHLYSHWLWLWLWIWLWIWIVCALNIWKRWNNRKLHTISRRSMYSNHLYERSSVYTCTFQWVLLTLTKELWWMVLLCRHNTHIIYMVLKVVTKPVNSRI